MSSTAFDPVRIPTPLLWHRRSDHSQLFLRASHGAALRFGRGARPAYTLRAFRRPSARTAGSCRESRGCEVGRSPSGDRSACKEMPLVEQGSERPSLPFFGLQREPDGGNPSHHGKHRRRAQQIHSQEHGPAQQTGSYRHCERDHGFENRIPESQVLRCAPAVGAPIPCRAAANLERPMGKPLCAFHGPASCRAHQAHRRPCPLARPSPADPPQRSGNESEEKFRYVTADNRTGGFGAFHAPSNPANGKIFGKIPLYITILNA